MLQAWLKRPRGDAGDAGVLRVRQHSRDELERAEEEKRRRQLTQRVQTAINARAGNDSSEDDEEEVYDSVNDILL